MRHATRALFAALLAAALAAPVLAAATADAPAASAPERAVAETLMRRSGLWTQLGAMLPQVRAGLAEAMAGRRPALRPQDAERLAASAGVAFAPERMQAVGLAALARALRPQHTPALLAWYAEPLGMRLARLEEAAAQDPQGPDAQLQAGMAALAAASSERRTVLDQIVQVTRSAEGMATMMINMSLAVQAGLSSSHPGLPGPSTRELRASLEAQRAHMEQGFAQYALALSASAYAEVADADLAVYAQFLASDAGRHFTEAGMRAIEAAVIDGATEFGRGLGGARESATT